MELLKQLYLINSKSGHEEAIATFVREHIGMLDDPAIRVEQDFMGSIFITKGTAKDFPCVVAHLDEVHSPSQRNIIIDRDTIYAVDDNGGRIGCGADDKNGIWIALRLLAELPVLKVALFVEEERDGDLEGCRGSRACDMWFFNDCRYLLQCDRKGASDVVTVGKEVRLCDDDFIPAPILRQYGFSLATGNGTDVVALKQRGLSQPCCNISCGYYEPHKDEEYTVVSELRNTLAFVRSVIECLSTSN